MKNYIKDIAFAILAGTFVIGGLGTTRPIYVFYFGLIFTFLLLILNYIWKGSLKFPPRFGLYTLFLIFSAISIFWSIDRQMSYEVILLFISGGLFWLLFYNAADAKAASLFSNLFDWFEKFVIYSGIVFGIFYLYARLSSNLISPFGLSLYLQEVANHNHLGDLQAVVLIVVIPHIIQKTKKKLVWWLMAGWSLAFLIISQSRSAYLSLAIGALFLASKYGWLKKYKKYFDLLTIITLGLFLIAGSQKTLLFSRDYYFQAASGIIDNPFGVGLGNFSEISYDPKYHIFGMDSYAKFVHNIVLEIFVGIGIFGVVFLYWLIKAILDILKVKNPQGKIAASVFLALTVNFFFDYTYFVPTLLWLWFASLGLSQALNKLKR